MTEILKLGSRGEATSALQSKLIRAGAQIQMDAAFGPATEQAVLALQKRLGLVEDGKVGPQTMRALDELLAPVVPGKPEPDKSAMATPVKAPPGSQLAVPIPPPNVNDLVLLDTARPISEIIYHCAATREGQDFTVEDIRAWHKARGWSDIGYHYVVARDGSIYVGRPVGQVGSHVAGHNTGTIGVCYIGGVAADGKTPKDTRTPEQRSSLLWLNQQLKKKHVGIRKVSGHNEYAAKACPSFNVQLDSLSQAA